MKMMVLYHSKTGNTEKMAKVIAEGMERVDGVAAKVCPIEEVDEEWAAESRCIVLGSPIYVSSVCAAVKDWLDGPCKNASLPESSAEPLRQRIMYTAAATWESA